MKLRMITLAGLGMALAACTTTGSGLPSNAIESAWLGKSAGTFFANYGPPISDTSEGGMTIYTWKGGYKSVRVPAKYAEGDKGKKGKRISPAQTRNLSCTVSLKVDDSYTIRSITKISDRPGLNGASYCAEFLAGAKD
jgi:hypothetical protein